MNKALFSSASVEWETPQKLFDALHARFGFTLDVCAQPGNAKCTRYECVSLFPSVFGGLQ